MLIHIIFQYICNHIIEKINNLVYKKVLIIILNLLVFQFTMVFQKKKQDKVIDVITKLFNTNILKKKL